MSGKHTWHLTIRRNWDGAIRVYHMEDMGDLSEDGSDYWFSEGNASCDCNREMWFARAGGEEELDRPACGHDGYDLLSVTQDDGEMVFYSEE